MTRALVSRLEQTDEIRRYHLFVNVAIFLSLVTMSEIVLIFLPFSFWVVLSLLIVLSLVKFFCVILWFMHLIFDKVVLFSLFLFGLLAAIGTATALIFLFSPEDVIPAEVSVITPQIQKFDSYV